MNFSDSKYFCEFLDFHAHRTPQKLALSDFFGSELSYGDLFSESKKAAGFLLENGLDSLDRVIVSLGNTCDQAIWHYGVMLSGGISVPLQDNLPLERLKVFIQDSGAKFLVSRDGIFDLATMDRLGDLSDIARFTEAFVVRPLENVCSILYTTGSTGRPKGVALTQSGMIAALTHILSYISYSEHTREMIVLPISHSFGLGHMYCSHISGGYVHLENGLTRLKRFFSALQDRKINGMCATPTICQLLTERYREKFLLSSTSLDYMVVNSAPLPPETTTKLISLKAHLKVIVYYGLTEASRSSFITLTSDNAEVYHTVGKAAKGVVIELIDGEICIRGPHLFKGYWGQELETKKVLKQGCFHTGDLGEFDSDKNLVIKGRIKDQINVGGLKISPKEVECAIEKNTMVKDVAVVGVDDPDNLRGQVVGALVVLEDGLTGCDLVHKRQLLDHCSDLLEPHALPSVLKFTSLIPRSESGKILRGEVSKCLI